jgi:hypothetical protein
MPSDSNSKAADRPVAQPVKFTVDGERLTSRDHTLSPNQIMILASIDPTTHYLVGVKGREQTSYRDRPDEEILIHTGDKFVTLYTGSTPVS